MAVKKSALKQYLKLALQGMLSIKYNFSLKRSGFDKKLMLFADSNSDSLPESMRLLYDELKSRGYRCEAWCLDFSRASLFKMLSFVFSFMGRYAQAGGLVICNYFVPAHACKKRSETKVVQLWHSCGALKKFGYSTPNDIPKSYKGSVSRNIDLVTVSAPVCESVFKEAFALKDGIARAVGVSRTDVFFDKEFEKASLRKLYSRCPQLEGKKILLYLPTFQGDASHAYSVGLEQVKALKKSMKGWAVIIKQHPRIKSRGRFDDFEASELMVCADMLITDYSSVVFEYALLDRPMLLWCPTLDEYIEERDFYLDFKREMPCPIVTDGERLEEEVRKEYESFKSGRLSDFTDRYMSACDGNSTRRIADFFK
ncbi:MAG: CDP-glycerol glycerophosphotransferase family protein [Ruminococcus sp.]|nr:CDP-glycerol glycerophosphotransferase family protein [Ruminococcus sp.]